MFSKVFFVIPAFLLLLAAPHFAALAQERSVPENATQVQLSFSPVVKKVLPAVVNIYTRRTVSQRLRHPFFDDPFFGPMFRDDMFGGRMRKQVESALGSGVILQPDGLVVTNAHVIRGADEITVGLSDGREFDARLVISDEHSDLALLRLDVKDKSLPYVSLKPSESLEVGDIVLAIGNPFGVGQTVTSGIVSATGRSSLDINDFNFFIQTDAAINPGNSGGPLVALDGGVVGINSAIYSRDGGSLGIGFAIPSEMVASVVAAESAGNNGKGGIARPWLGVSVQNVTSDIAESLGLEKPGGVLITALHSSSPLKAAGIAVGDVVLGMNGRPLRDAYEMKFRMATVALGQQADFEISRKGKPLHFRVEAITPPDTPPRRETVIKGQNPLNGAVIANINPAVANELGLDPEEEKGVVVMEAPPRGYFGAAVRQGEVLLEINGRKIANVDDVSKALQSPTTQGWHLIVRNNGQTRQVLIR